MTETASKTMLNIIGRRNMLFDNDIAGSSAELKEVVENSRFLVIGGAGSIGQAVVLEIFKRSPKVLHVVDVSENNLVELVRNIRSSIGYIDGDFRTFVLDCGSLVFDAMCQEMGPYDFILNLSALKHVRSEKDPYTLMRLIETNILNTIKTISLAIEWEAKKYFSVSTDKASNPVNMMGASKLIMEKYLLKESSRLPISSARFANVAFSDGSLLYGFKQRLEKQQPISAPRDVRRYFITPQESGELCLLSCILGKNRELFFPKLSEDLRLMTFSDIATRFLHAQGYEVQECASEDEARSQASKCISNKRWPCYFFASDTTGEKDFEEFFTEKERLDLERYEGIGVIINEDGQVENGSLDEFVRTISRLKSRGRWNKSELLAAFESVLPEFNHLETGKYLDGKM